MASCQMHQWKSNEQFHVISILTSFPDRTLHFVEIQKLLQWEFLYMIFEHSETATAVTEIHLHFARSFSVVCNKTHFLCRNSFQLKCLLCQQGEEISFSFPESHFNVNQY